MTMILPSPEPEKRPIGRPRKEKVYGLNGEEFHYLNDLLKESFRYERELIKYFLAEYNDDQPCGSRKRFDIGKKLAIRKHHAVSGNFRETARAFEISEATVRKICKPAPPEGERNINGIIHRSSSCQGNKTGVGKTLSYPSTIEDDLLAWVLDMIDKHLPISAKLLGKQAKILINPHNPNFKGSNGWYQKFLKRHTRCLRRSP